jgi:hypothetical protein
MCVFFSNSFITQSTTFYGHNDMDMVRLLAYITLRLS